MMSHSRPISPLWPAVKFPAPVRRGYSAGVIVHGRYSECVQVPLDPGDDCNQVDADNHQTLWNTQAVQ